MLMTSVLHVDIEPSQPTIFAVQTFNEPRKSSMKIYCFYPEGDHFVCHCGRTFRTQKNYKEHFCWSDEDTEDHQDTESEGIRSEDESVNTSPPTSP